MLLLALLLSFDGCLRYPESGSSGITTFIPDFITESIESVRNKMAEIVDTYATMEFGNTGLELRISPYDVFSGRSKIDLSISF